MLVKAHFDYLKEAHDRNLLGKEQRKNRLAQVTQTFTKLSLPRSLAQPQKVKVSLDLRAKS